MKNKNNEIENQPDGVASERLVENGEVGYRRPPKSTRFRPGQSGNPKGRPKGSLNMQTVLMATLRKKVTINENGKRRQVTKFEAAFMQLANKAASGDSRAFRLLIELAREAEEKQSAEGAEPPPLKVTDQKIMARLLERFQTQNKAENPQQEEIENV